jgi:hypothetical protein
MLQKVGCVTMSGIQWQVNGILFLPACHGPLNDCKKAMPWTFWTEVATVCKGGVEAMYNGVRMKRLGIQTNMMIA